ncbi:MAG: metal-dependent phosphohydrolase, partial [Planctomycetaceae bacterium]|nr:metal-dependent phosphohydrolase [Planctomycetaceae bacterium]
SALLHDIGHWPFCHPIEDLALPNMPPHESFAAEFLSADTELSDVLISQWKVQPDEVLQTLTGRSSDSSLQLRQSILSGPVDIDKMDYLNRDSQHCGVPYGRNFDRQRLISSLIVNESGDGLAITAKGRTAAEMMVFARYVMFSEVYWHHAVRSATTMFARAFYELHG